MMPVNPGCRCQMGNEAIVITNKTIVMQIAFVLQTGLLSLIGRPSVPAYSPALRYGPSINLFLWGVLRIEKVLMNTFWSYRDE